MATQLTIILVLLPVMVLAALPRCKRGEFHYEYTECGSDGGRWHVAVPRDPTHCTVDNKPPIRQKSCDSSCPSGQFLDVSTLKEQCKLCPKGTHSMGSSVRYNNWTILPPEFDAYPIANYERIQPAEEDSGCNATWIADGMFLRTTGTSCIARLTYSTTIVQREGSLTFRYYYSNYGPGSIYFDTFVQNEECRISKQDDDDYDMDYETLRASSHYKLLNYTLKLKRGRNLIVWEVENWNPSGRSFSDSVFIRDIEVKGVSFSTECAPCPAGTFAEKEGSGWCKSCPKDHISTEGSDKCTPCDTAKEYAPFGTNKCILRKPCTKNDYVETSSRCDKDNKFQTVYKWIQPKICAHSIKDAVKLPAPGPKKDCAPCNPGMFLNASQCLFCPPGTFSDGKKPCEKCPASTAPVLGYNLKSWRSLPSTAEIWCSSSFSCSTRKGWQLRRDFMDSGFGHDDNARLFFEIHTGGFAGTTGLVSRVANTIGTVLIDFELDCDGPCIFSMYETDNRSPSRLVTEWEGRHARQSYRYAVTSKDTQLFYWKFVKTASSNGYSHGKQTTYINDRVKIYEVVITNTVLGGAEKCRECPAGLHETGCVECPEGHYVDKASKKCKPCQEGTYLSNNTCVPCGPGLTSTKGSSRCYSSCHYHTKDDRHIDFASLNGTHSMQTQKAFLMQGTPYFYEYHINLCGLNVPPARCHRNMTFHNSDNKAEQYMNASICQMRIIPGKNNGPSLSAEITGIGHQLMGVYDEKPENLSLDVFKNDKLVNESLLYFDFLSHTTTTSCPNGRSAWIILKCDSEASGKGTIKVPSECLEGTCDGCQFLFLWHTRYACPLCSEKYYNRLEAGCMHRKKAIHYIWNTTPKECVDGVHLPSLEYEDCEEMTVNEAVKKFQIPIGVVAFVVTAIIASFVFLWYKNRVLKYKLYTRVAVTDNQSGELPAAPSCVVDDDDEEERVEFRKRGNPGKKLIKKLKDFSKNNEGEDMKLNDASFEVELS